MKTPTTLEGATGFTIMELMTVLVIITILSLFALPLYEGLEAKAAKANCSSNLKGLYVAASGHLQDKGQWPQIDPALLEASEKSYFKAWIKAFEPYGVSHKSWICPTIQRAFNDPPYWEDEHFRTDYVAMPFDARQFAPHEYTTQPWFLEKADAHGDGNLLIYGDGSVDALETVRDRAGGA